MTRPSSYQLYSKTSPAYPGTWQQTRFSKPPEAGLFSLVQLWILKQHYDIASTSSTQPWASSSPTHLGTWQEAHPSIYPEAGIQASDWVVDPKAVPWLSSSLSQQWSGAVLPTQDLAGTLPQTWQEPHIW